MIKINLFVIKLASGDRMFFWQVEEEMMMHKLCELMVTHRKNLKVCSDPIQRSFEGLLNELVFFWQEMKKTQNLLQGKETVESSVVTVEAQQRPPIIYQYSRRKSKAQQETVQVSK